MIVLIPPDAACSGGQSVFHDECIGPRKEAMDSRIFDTLSRQVFRNGDAGKTLVVKIDVEGAELASLLATSDGVLGRIDQLAMEIHGTDGRFLELVRKLKRTFHVVHLHFNNQACSPKAQTLASLGLPGALREQANRDPRSSQPQTHLAAPARCPGQRLGARLRSARGYAIATIEGIGSELPST